MSDVKRWRTTTIDFVGHMCSSCGTEIKNELTKKNVCMKQQDATEAFCARLLDAVEADSINIDTNNKVMTIRHRVGPDDDEHNTLAVSQLLTYLRTSKKGTSFSKISERKAKQSTLTESSVQDKSLIDRLPQWNVM